MNHYTLRHRMVAWISQRFFRTNIYRTARGLAHGLRRKGGLGFVPLWLVPESECAEHAALRSIEYEARTVFDVGAFEGLTALFFASRGAVVHAFEPMPATRARLRDNVALNAPLSVHIHDVAVGREPGRIEICMDPLMPGGASAASTIASQIGSLADAQRLSVEVIALDQWVDSGRLPRPDMIKVDVEGFEVDVLRGARSLLSRWHPILFIELHGEDIEDKVSKTRAVIHELEAAGYRDIVHVESGSTLTAGAVSALYAQGHLLVGVKARQELPLQPSVSSAA